MKINLLRSCSQFHSCSVVKIILVKAHKEVWYQISEMLLSESTTDKRSTQPSHNGTYHDHDNFNLILVLYSDGNERQCVCHRKTTCSSYAKSAYSFTLFDIISMQRSLVGESMLLLLLVPDAEMKEILAQIQVVKEEGVVKWFHHIMHPWYYSVHVQISTLSFFSSD